MQQPATAGSTYGDTAVPARVAAQRHEEHVVRDGPHRREAEPVVADHVVAYPQWSVRPLGSDVAGPLAQGRALGCVQLLAEDVDPGPREVSEPARVVEVEVGDGHVGDVVDRETQCPDLRLCGLGHREPRPQRRDEGSPEAARVGDVSGAEACVNEQQAMGALDEQAVRDHPRRRDPSAQGAARTQGMALPPIKHFKSGFLRMRAFCGDAEVTPIHPFKLEQRVSESDMIDEGLYVFDPGALGPHCATVKLVMYSEKEPEKGDTRVVDPKVLQQIWQDFAPYREL